MIATTAPGTWWILSTKRIKANLHQTSKLQLESFWQDHIQLNHLTLLSLSVQHSSRIMTLPFHHRDPYDLLIIAQSLGERIPVMSIDAVFNRYGVSRIW